MNYNDLMSEVSKMFESWMEDKDIIDHFSGDTVEIQREFLNCIQIQIKSSFVLKTEKEVLEKAIDWYNSMEGLN